MISETTNNTYSGGPGKVVEVPTDLYGFEMIRETNSLPTELGEASGREGDDKSCFKSNPAMNFDIYPIEKDTLYRVLILRSLGISSD